MKVCVGLFALALCFSCLVCTDAAWEATFLTSYFHGSDAEIGTPLFEESTQQVYVLEEESQSIDVLAYNEIGGQLTLVGSLPGGPHGELNGAALVDGLLALSYVADDETDNGVVVLFETRDGEVPVQASEAIVVGSGPDSLEFSPDRRTLAVSNLGKYSTDPFIDPEGSVSLIDVSGNPSDVSSANVRSVSFSVFNDVSIPDEVILAPPPEALGASLSVAQLLEPESLTFQNDDTLFVNCGANNALVRIDVSQGEATSLMSWGAVDRSRSGKGFDSSDQDGGINIRTWDNVKTLRIPNSITFINGDIFSADRGSSRAFNELGVAQVAGTLSPSDFDAAAFPDAASILEPENLGLINVMNNLGLNEGGVFETLYSIGGRTVSSMRTNGDIRSDTGDMFEQALADLDPDNFNSLRDEQPSFDEASPILGPRPYSIASGELGGDAFVFVTLNEQGGVIGLDVSDSDNMIFEFYASNRDFSVPIADAGDTRTTDVIFVSEEQSSGDFPVLIVTNEESSTTTVWTLSDSSSATTLSLFTMLSSGFVVTVMLLTTNMS